MCSYKMDASSSPYSNITFIPLKNGLNTTVLKDFENIVRTSFGPSGKLKIIQNVSGGNVTVTSTSKRLFSIVATHNTFLKLILSSVKTHLKSFHDNGLLCALIILKLINNSFSLTYPLCLVGKLYEYFGKIFVDSLNVEKNSCVLNMEICEISNLQSVINSVLETKPGCIFTQSDKRMLSSLLIKAFLNSIPSNQITLFKNIYFISIEGISCHHSALHEGLMIKYTGMVKNILIDSKILAPFKIILFTVSLSGDAEFPIDKIEINSNINVWNAILTYLKDVVKQLIDAKIQILACQKVVHPSLKKLLEDANILVVDRLGAEVAENLEYLIGSSNTSLLGNWSFGFISSVSKKTICNKDFLLFSNNQRPFSTILICNFNEQAVSETQIVCQQAIDTLYNLLKKPQVCYGAGCTEIYTAKLTENKILECLNVIQQEIGCTKSQVLSVLDIFLQSIIDVAIAIHQGTTLEFVTDKRYNHLWKLNAGNFPENNQTCMCGKFLANDINKTDWIFLSKNLNNLLTDTNNHHLDYDETVKKQVVLDNLISKVNAYSVAFETASTLMRVSICISNER